MIRLPSGNVLLVLLAGLVALCAGCEDNFDPLNQERDDYTVYGALNLYADVNHVRVRNLDAPFTADSTRELDVTVTLTDEGRGVTETLQDSVVQYENVNTHNFRALMDIRPETQYRLTVRPDRGEDTLQVTTTTPRIAERSAEPTGMDCETPIQLTFDPVQSPQDIKVVVGFRHKGEREETEVQMESADAPDQITTTFTPKEVLNTPPPCVPPEYEPPPTWCHDLDTAKLYIKYIHFGPESTWLPEADSVSLSGGTGAFRSYYRDEFPVPIDTTNVCEPNCGCGGWNPGLP
jgi:hypothetical protein